MGYKFCTNFLFKSELKADSVLDFGDHVKETGGGERQVRVLTLACTSGSLR